MPDENFITSYVADNDVLVIKLHGKLDVASLTEFNTAVQKHFDEGRRKIVIDCAHLGYISSVGIGALVTLQTRLRKQGGEVKLAAIQGAVADVLHVVKLDTFLDMHGDIQFALESFHA